MSDLDEDLGHLDGEEQEIEQTPSSRRSSFVERTRQIINKTGNDAEDDEDKNEIDVRREQIDDTVHSQEATPTKTPVEVDPDAAFYDEVDQDWEDPVPKSQAPNEIVVETEDIPEDIIPNNQEGLVSDFPPPTEVEEELESRTARDDPEQPGPAADFEVTEVTDEVERPVFEEIQTVVASSSQQSSAEKVHQKSVSEERAALKLQQVEVAESLALAAGRQKAERKEALRLREAKRHEDFVRGSRNNGDDPTHHLPQDRGQDSNGDLLENDAVANSAVSKHKQFLPHIPKRARAGPGKSKVATESDDEGSGMAVAGGAMEDPTKEQKALRSKGLVTRPRRSRVSASTAGDESVDEEKDSPQVGGVGMVEGSSLSRNSSQDPKPPRRKVGGAVGRPGRRLASSTTDDSAEREGDGTRLPPLVHPRSSPDPSQFGDAEAMSSGEGGDLSQKSRRHRKPLFLRMIERAQQQTLEDEKQKHEQYAQQKKIRQKNNPSAEELREHRQKHDELMRAKHEEAKRNMAEAAAANARAVVKKPAPAAAVASSVTDPVESQKSAVTEGPSPAKKKKKKATTSRHVSADDSAVAAAVGIEFPALNDGVVGGPGLHSLDNGFSPVKHKRSSTKSPHQSSAHEKFKESSPSKSGKGAVSPVRRLSFDAEAVSQAVARLPELSADSVSAFCAPDWLAAFARPDLDEVNNDRETSTSIPTNLDAFLRAAPPTIDAYKLMYSHNSL